MRKQTMTKVHHLTRHNHCVYQIKFMKKYLFSILTFLLFSLLFTGKSYADTLQQLSSDGNGRVTFHILNPPSGFDFSSLYSAGASWDNSNWVYAISYEGGCPDACVVEWQGQTTTPFYVKLANQTQSIIFNQS